MNKDISKIQKCFVSPDSWKSCTTGITSYWISRYTKLLALLKLYSALSLYHNNKAKHSRKAQR